MADDNKTLGVGSYSGIIGSVIGAISNGITNAVNYKTIKEQNKFQREQFEYQKYLNNLQMQREDTAVQRRMADYKAAGLNPLMADGSEAQAGSYASSSHSGAMSSINGFDSSTLVSALLDAERIKNEKAMTKLEGQRVASQLLNDYENRLLTIEQRINTTKDTEVKSSLIDQYNANITVLNAQAKKLGVETEYLEWDKKIDMNRGTKSGENTGTTYNEAKDILAPGIYKDDGKGGKGGKTVNPVKDTAVKVSGTASPIKKKAIDRLNKNIGKKKIRGRRKKTTKQKDKE